MFTQSRKFIYATIGAAFVSLTATQGAFAQLLPPQAVDHVTQVLYEGILFREPDAPGFQTNREIVACEGIEGAERIAQYAVGTPEFWQLARTHSPDQLLSQAYWTFFRHGPDQYAAMTWLPYLNQGNFAGFYTNLIASPEFYEVNAGY